MPGKLSREEIYAFLDNRPGWIALTSIGRDGYPHTVPIGYFRLGDELYIGCRAGTQKLKNIERNPKVSLMLESGTTMQDIKGVVIQGDATVITDDLQRLELQREAMRRRGVDEAHLPVSASPGAAYIRVVPRR